MGVDCHIETNKGLINRYKRVLETCPQSNLAKNGHAIFFCFSPTRPSDEYDSAPSRKCKILKPSIIRIKNLYYLFNIQLINKNFSSLAILNNSVVAWRLKVLVHPKPKIFNLVTWIIFVNLFYAIFIMPVTAYWNYRSFWPFGKTFCKAQAFLRSTCITANGMIIW